MVSPRRPSQSAASPSPDAARAHPANGRANKADSATAVRPHLEAIWAASKDAVRHGTNVARVSAWELQIKARRQLALLAIRLVGAMAATAAVVTMTVWGTAHLLTELSTAMGGGLPGCLAALAIMSATAGIITFVWRTVRNRRRTAELRARLRPGTAAKTSALAPEIAELHGMRQEATADLHADKNRISNHARALIKNRPLTALGVSAASGLLVTRLAMTLPRSARRSALGVIRMLRSAGLASLVSAAFARADTTPSTRAAADPVTDGT